MVKRPAFSWRTSSSLGFLCLCLYCPDVFSGPALSSSAASQPVCIRASQVHPARPLSCHCFPQNLFCHHFVPAEDTLPSSAHTTDCWLLLISVLGATRHVCLKIWLFLGIVAAGAPHPHCPLSSCSTFQECHPVDSS